MPTCNAWLICVLDYNGKTKQCGTNYDIISVRMIYLFLDEVTFLRVVISGVLIFENASES